MNDSANAIAHAAQLLRAGELVAFPTETVYGLGADARNPIALAKIFAAKGRPADHPLIVHLPDATHLDAWAIDIPAAAHTLAAACWPGPLTLILKRHPAVPDLVTGGQNTIGVQRHQVHSRIVIQQAAFYSEGLRGDGERLVGHGCHGH